MTPFTKRFDVRASVIYGVVATLWIVFAHLLGVHFFRYNPAVEDAISLFKDLGFVVLTTVALFIILSAETRKRSRIEQQLLYERDISPVAILVFNIDGHITYANIQAEAIVGQPRSEIVGKTFDRPDWKVTDYEGKPVPDNSHFIIQMIQTRQPIFGVQRAIEVVYGKRVLLEFNLAPLFNDAGRLTASVATFTDVTSNKTHEKRLRESEFSLKRAQAIAHLGDWTWDAETNIVRWSDEMYHIFGIDRASFTGNVSKIMQTAVHPDDRARIMQANETFLMRQQSGVLDYRIVWADGSVRVVRSETGEPFTDAQGKIQHVWGILQDITENRWAEKALIESEARYRTLVEQASDGILIANVDGLYVEANSAACNLLGYTREEILQKKMLDLFKIAPDKPLRYQELQEGKTLLRERQMIRKDGTLVWVEVSSKLLSDGKVQAIARDITERKRAEEELHLKSSALEAAANGIAIIDINGIIEWVNPAFTALNRYMNDEANGHNPSESMQSGQHNELFHDEMWRTILDGHVWRGETVNRHRLGTLFTEEMTITPVHNESNEISHFIAIKQDITERKLSEMALQNLNIELEARVTERTTQLNQIKDRIELILNSNPDSIVYSQLDGKIEQINPAFTQIFGYQADEIVLQPLTQLVIPDDVPSLEQAMASVVGGQQTQQVDVTAYCKDGTTFDAVVMLAPVIENGEQMVGIVSSVHDITYRNHMLHQAMDLGEIKSRYIAMAAHDLHNPMAVILSSSDIVERYYDRLDDEKKQAKFAQIRASIKVMTDILDDILVLGEVESGKLTFHPALLDIIEFCQMIIRETLEATGTSIPINFSTEGVEPSVTMDAKLVRHVLGNLLSNAIKYSANNSTVIFTAKGQSDHIQFRIQDQGIGIPKEEQAKLFETFHRASNAKHIRGTGLGLAIVKQSVELHDGTIEFESEEGVGTTFIVTLPTTSALAFPINHIDI